jgi:anti-sigma factor RsiW
VRNPEPVELAALADGSLPPNRRAALEARVAASPELGDRLDEQQRAVALARSAALEVEAPPSLRALIEPPGRSAGARGRRRVLACAATALVTVTVLAVALSAARSHPSHDRFAAALRSARAVLEPPNDLPAGAVETAHHSPLRDAEGTRRLLVRKTGDVDRDEDVAECVR